jgi:hypothetical protein
MITLWIVMKNSHHTDCVVSNLSASAMTWRSDGNAGVVAGMCILNVVGSDVAEDVQLV